MKKWFIRGFNGVEFEVSMKDSLRVLKRDRVNHSYHWEGNNCIVEIPDEIRECECGDFNCLGFERM